MGLGLGGTAWDNMDTTKSVCVPRELYEDIRLAGIASLITPPPDDLPMGPPLYAAASRLKWMGIGGAVAIVLAFFLWGRR